MKLEYLGILISLCPFKFEALIPRVQLLCDCTRECVCTMWGCTIDAVFRTCFLSLTLDCCSPGRVMVPGNIVYLPFVLNVGKMNK